MDPVLAQIYGTNSEASDLEKLASAQMEEELGQDGSYTEDDVEMLAQAVLNDIEAEQDGGEYGVDADDETMAKVAEADKLGRVMAHSMWQELGHIKMAAEGDIHEAPMSKGGKAPKGASRQPKMTPEQLASQARGEHDVPGTSSHKHVSPTKREAAAMNRKGQRMMSLGQQAGSTLRHTGKRIGHHMASTGSSLSHRLGYTGAMSKGRAQAIGAAAHGLGALAAGGLAYGAKKAYDKSKESSALDTLAEARALEILEANGIDPSELTKVASDPSEVLGEAVEQRAWDILAQYGLSAE